MSLIRVSGLTFSYEGSYDNIFENASFQIDTDWKLGFTGRNGKGKTTFLHLLMGRYPYEGTISGNVTYEYFPYEIKDAQRDTLSIAQEISPQSELWEFQRELSLLEVSEDTLYRPFRTLSGGEKTKVLLSAMFLKENRFLLIDEPTSHLDGEARLLLSKYLRSKKGFLLVSHDRRFLDRCVDHILAIENLGIQVQKGNFSSWYENKRMRDEWELAENERLKRDIDRLREAARRTSKWSSEVEKTKNGQKVAGIKPDKGHIGHQAAKMMKRSKSIENRREAAIDEKKKLLKNVDRADALAVRPLAYRSQRLASLEGVSIHYGGRIACEDISLEILRNDRISLEGKNGSGKSSLLKLLLGEEAARCGKEDVFPSYVGSAARGSGLVVSYVPQTTDHLRGSLTALARERGLEESLFKAILAKLGFSKIQFEKGMEAFSQGQKKKVLIAASLCERAHLYLWDEPLNYIDVVSRMQIEELLLSCRPTMVFVEHDQAFAERIASRRFVLT